MFVRPATEADIEGIVDVILKAQPFDPQCLWRYPAREQHLNEHYNNFKLMIEYFLKPEYVDTRLVVADARDREDPTKSKVAAVAIWDVSYLNLRKHGKDYVVVSPAADARNDPRHQPWRSIDPARHAAFGTGMAAACDRFLNDVYGRENMLLLGLMLTHPDYWRQGLGSALVRWGLEMAAKEEEQGRKRVVVSLLASPMGARLYSHLGFKLLGTQVIRVEGEQESVVYDAMVHEGGSSRHNVR